MANTRILIHQNDEVIKVIDQAYLNKKTLLIAKANAVKGQMAGFNESFEKTGYTTTKYNQLLSAGPQSYIDARINKIKDQCINAGITSSAVMIVATERIEQSGNTFNKAYVNLLSYLDQPAKYPGLKFELSDVTFVNSITAIKSEKDLEGLKDSNARQYIHTEAGYDLVAKAESLVTILNSINDVLRANNIYNITELNEFGDFAKYKYKPHGHSAELELNIQGVYDCTRKIKSKIAS